MHDTASFQLDDAGRLARRVPCVRCGYDLYGLDPSGTCPECGGTIAFSLQKPLLRFAHPAWVRTLFLGSTLIFAGCVGSMFRIDWGFRTPLYELLWHLAWWLVPGVLMLLGFVLITRPDPAQSGYGPSGLLRRSTLCVAVLLFLLQGWGANYRSQHHQDPWPVLGPTVSEFVAPVAILIIGHFAMRLATRLPNTDLLRHTRWVMWGIFFSWMSIIFGNALLIGLDMWVGLHEPGQDTGFVVERWGQRVSTRWATFQLPFVLVMGVAALWALVLSIGYMTELKNEAKLARQLMP